MTTAFGNLSPDRLARGIYWQRSWNIVLGCSPASPGCAHCWSAREAKRFTAHPNPIISNRYAGLTQGDTWSGVVRPNPAALDIPLGRKKPTVFALWTDLFHEDVPDSFRDQVVARMATCPQHVFLVLTKRPERMLEYLTDASTARADGRGEALLQINPQEPLECIPWPLPNVFVGATAEDQQRLDERAPHLMDLAAAGWRTWLSLEPLLGPMDIRRFLPFTNACTRCSWAGHGWDRPCNACGRQSDNDLWDGDICPFCGKKNEVVRMACPECGQVLGGGNPEGLFWIICGGETGPGARPMHPDWLRAVRGQCVAAGVPLLIKQWGEWLPDNQNPNITGSGAHDRGAIRVGKKRAGRILDGQTWTGLPNI